MPSPRRGTLRRGVPADSTAAGMKRRNWERASTFSSHGHAPTFRPVKPTRQLARASTCRAPVHVSMFLGFPCQRSMEMSPALGQKCPVVQGECVVLRWVGTGGATSAKVGGAVGLARPRSPCGWVVVVNWALHRARYGEAPIVCSYIRPPVVRSLLALLDGRSEPGTHLAARQMQLPHLPTSNSHRGRVL